MSAGPAPQCLSCRHLDRDNLDTRTCAAFPEGIPAAIFERRADHAQPFPGDRGIRFELMSIEELRAATAARRRAILAREQADEAPPVRAASR